ncbi:MAG: T9SS type A sorting domain-containing protein, partial [Ferruginibacter sp.]
MKQNFTFLYLLLLLFIGSNQLLLAQNSVLINFGSSTCNAVGAPAFSMINNPLTATPTALSNCSMAAQLPDFYSVFVAYNPKNNLVYIADVRSGANTKIWTLDIGLPNSINCPASIPVNPNYSYSYVSNNFEFDNNGDLWSFSNYNISTGQCNMDKFDVNTGTVLSTKILQFPAGNYPTAISSGDLTILPNGRMFATLGSFPSRLYEIVNYSSAGGIATANFLQTLPQSCYGIAYLNGQLELTGADFSSSCYYFDYNISTNTLGALKTFQNGQLPIDNTSFTPSLGTTKRLTNAVKINANTADLTYEIYVRNLGNVLLREINVSEDLGAVFGAANVSNVSANFVPGANSGNLLLNPFFNGTTITSILENGQNLPNQTAVNTDYFFKVEVKCRVTNLNTTTTYLNTAIGRAIIGTSANGTLINISDSSNNGTSAVVDPNNNANAGELGENVPTPFNFGAIPVRFMHIQANKYNATDARIYWQVAIPVINGEKFEVEWSSNAIQWNTLTTVPILNITQQSYTVNHLSIPKGLVYYRIKQTDKDGFYIYSKTVIVQNNNSVQQSIVYPNPANQFIQINTPDYLSEKSFAILSDAIGRKISVTNVVAGTTTIATDQLPNGTYVLQIDYG